MRRVALLAGILTVGLATPAAGWVELPPRVVPGDGVADCLRPAGPGRLALLGPLGRTTAATDLLTVGPHGIAPDTTTTLGWLERCAEVGTAHGSAPLLTALVAPGPGRPGSDLRAADAGTAPAIVRAGASVEGAPSVAVAPGGAAVVAWEEVRLRIHRALPVVVHVLAAVRASAGAPFGPPRMLGRGSPFAAQPAVGIDAAGRATVAWLSGDSLREPPRLRIATATPGGGRFVAAQPLPSASGAQVALAVTPAGRAMVLVYGLNPLAAYERAADGSAFARVAVPGIGSPDEASLALADDGSAVIAARNPSAPVVALLRPAGGAFGRRQLLQRGARDRGSSVTLLFFGFGRGDRPVAPHDERGGRIAVALGAAGRVLVTWVDPGGRGDAAAAHVARGTIASGISTGRRLGSPCRTANAAQPLALPDGTFGVAWTDNARIRSGELGDEEPLGGGELHAVLPGRSGAMEAGASPGLSARPIGPLALHGGRPVRVRVRCRKPCVVRGTIASHSLNPVDDSASLVAGSTELPHGHGVLTLAPAAGDTFARRRSAPTRLTLLACAPAGAGVTRVTLPLRLRRLPLLPLPHVLGLTARRRGSRIHVTWHTSTPTRGATFYVVAHPLDRTHPAYAELAGHGRSRFSVTLHERPGHRARTVWVQVSTREQPYDEPTTRVRIR